MLGCVVYGEKYRRAAHLQHMPDACARAPVCACRQVGRTRAVTLSPCQSQGYVQKLTPDLDSS